MLKIAPPKLGASFRNSSSNQVETDRVDLVLDQVVSSRIVESESPQTFLISTMLMMGAG